MMTSPLRAARKGNRAAFVRLYDEHHLPLFRLAWRLTNSVADAEDIVQECFLGLLRPACPYNPARTPLRTYLFGVVRNQALKRFRGKHDGTADPPAVPDYRSPEFEALRAETSEIVSQAIRCLPDLQREVLILAHYEQLALAEIAAILEIEVPAVKSRLQRARAALREVLAEHAGRTV
jgi:RNA polymerase sigma-70 factor (ECF subfamily)